MPNIRKLQISWWAGAVAILISLASALTIYVAFLQQELVTRRILGFLSGGLVCFTFIAYLILTYFVFPILKGRKVWQIFFLAVFSLVFGLLLLTFAPGKLTGLSLFPNRLEIKVPGERNPASTGSRVELLAFRSGEKFISYNTFQDTGGWQRLDTSLVTPGLMLESLNWEGRVLDTVLVFRTSPDGGMVHVLWDGEEAVLDTWSASPGELSYPHQARISLFNFWFVLLAAGIAIGFIYLTLLVAVLKGFDTQFHPQKAVQPSTIQQHGFSNWILPLVVIFSILLFLWGTRKFGLWVQTDTVNYVSAARHLVAGKGYIAVNNDIFVWWPPLYPAVLSVLEAFSTDKALYFNWLLNGLLFGLTIFYSGRIALRLYPKQNSYYFLGLLLLVFSRPLLVSFSAAMSEPLFILFEVVFFFYLIRYKDTRDPFDAVLFTIAASLVGLARYIGVALLMVGCLLVMLVSHAALKRRFLQVCLFGFVSGLPLILWLARNYVLKGTLTGPRTGAEQSLAQNLTLLIKTVAGWYFPSGESLVGSLVVLVFLGFLLTAGILHASRSRQETWGTLAIFFGLVVLLYSFLIVGYLSLYQNAPIGDRILSPISIPLTLLIFSSVMNIREWIGRFRPKLANLAGWILLLVLLVAPIRYLVWLTGQEISTTRLQFSIYSLQDSRTVAYLREHPLAGDHPVSSNCPRCLYIFDDLHPSAILDGQPENTAYLPNPGEPFYLVWFGDLTLLPGGEKQSEVPDLSRLLGVGVNKQLLAELGDGKVLLVSTSK